MFHGLVPATTHCLAESAWMWIAKIPCAERHTKMTAQLHLSLSGNLLAQIPLAAPWRLSRIAHQHNTNTLLFARVWNCPLHQAGSSTNHASWCPSCCDFTILYQPHLQIPYHASLASSCLHQREAFLHTKPVTITPGKQIGTAQKAQPFALSHNRTHMLLCLCSHMNTS